MFTGQCNKWFDTFKTSSIRSWLHFHELFIKSHQDYDYDKLCEEIESLQRDEDGFIYAFNLSIMWNYYIFHDDDQPLE